MRNACVGISRMGIWPVTPPRTRRALLNFLQPDIFGDSDAFDCARARAAVRSSVWLPGVLRCVIIVGVVVICWV